MVNTNYRRGVEAERRARDELETQGYLVIRAAGSKGPIDLVAIGVDHLRLIQVKRTAGKPGHGLAKSLRALVDLSVPENASIELWQWCDGQGWGRWLVDGAIPPNWHGGLAD